MCSGTHAQAFSMKETFEVRFEPVSSATSNVRSVVTYRLIIGGEIATDYPAPRVNPYQHNTINRVDAVAGWEGAVQSPRSEHMLPGLHL